jgi:CheY-like chemotaxis protein
MNSPTLDALIVEDDADLRSAIIETLTEAGFRVAGAADGREALFRLRTASRPRVLLVDLMMPVMSGWALVETLRAQPAFADLPVLVITAVGPFWGWPESAARVLRKPLRLDDLIDAVSNYCDSPPAPPARSPAPLS